MRNDAYENLPECVQANISYLLEAARRRHELRSADVDGVTTKIGFLLVANAGLLAAVSRIPWTTSISGCVWATLLGIFVCSSLAFCWLSFGTSMKDVTFGSIRKDCVEKPAALMHDRMLAAYEEATRHNVERIARKMAELRVALFFWILATVLFGVQALTHGRQGPMQATQGQSGAGLPTSQGDCCSLPGGGGITRAKRQRGDRQGPSQSRGKN